ncbi:MAG: sugar ABC transporter ATP-binding protein [Spirochaetaceae bacterium]
MLELKNITKTFPGTKALDDVSLNFHPGEIHALLGENGAGKSTLINIICGIYSEYEGKVLLNGEQLELKSYQDALNHGISIVNQEIQTIPDSTVAENIMLDKLERFQKHGRINWKELNKTAEKYIDMVHLDIDSNEKVELLSTAQKQLIQIAKALASETPVLLLDEPTSALTEHETKVLFVLLRELKEQGKNLIFVSHKLEEIFSLCDKVSVIRDGRWIGTNSIEDLDTEGIIKMMIGRESTDEYLGDLNPDINNVVLEVKNLTLKNKVDNTSFKLKKGEILGFYGLVGSGRTELAKVLIGEDHPESGEVFVHGELAHIRSTSDALNKYSIGYVSENRKEEGLILDFPVVTNIGITIWNKIQHKISRRINTKKHNGIVLPLIGKLSIKVSDPMQEVQSLSGGNQQKVSIAKWLAADCDILIIDEPSIGVDIGAKEYIHELIWDLAKNQGKSIILISSDLPEMLKLSRRISVFQNKKIMGTIDNLTGKPKDNEEVSLKIGKLMV